MSRVFIVQRPAARERDGGWRAKFDFTDAERFGRLVDVLPIGEAGYWGIDSVVERAQRVLADFEPDEDYLLAAGDPVAIAAVAMVAANVSGKVKVLKWDKRDMSYRPYMIQV